MPRIALEDLEQARLIIADLREALGFYADPANWRVPDASDPFWYGASAVSLDEGEVALEALRATAGLVAPSDPPRTF